MKKILTLFFTFCMILLFVGCTDPHTDQDSNDNDEGKGSIGEMYIYIDDNKLTVTLEDNVSVKALLKILETEDISYTASDYGGFEKVGPLGRTLPTDNSQITTKAGDVVLYSGNQIVLFYGNNTWSYTKIGRISGCSQTELYAILGTGKKNIQVRLSLK